MFQGHMNEGVDMVIIEPVIEDLPLPAIADQLHLAANMPKYVFFFVGDGMSSSQIQATEAYLTEKNGGSATEAEDLLKTKIG
jgi:alkaline phosphatase